jgi:predicted NBD/HSP70 family sugar kinase
MRGLNRRTLLQRLKQLGTASRADLAKSLGMSAPTVGKIVDELMRMGVVEEVDGELEAQGDGAYRNSPRLGRPGRQMRLDRSRPRFVAVELGVAETRLAALPVAGRDTDEWQMRFATPRTAWDWRGKLAEAAKSLPRQGLWGALVSVPGVVDEAAGRVIFSPNLHWTEAVDLRDEVRHVWELPIELVQEERALALGHQAANPEEDNFLLVDVGEGVGAAIVIRGAVYQSPLPISGELGHTPVVGNNRPCGCGSVGCVETLIGRSGLLQSLANGRDKVQPTWPALRQLVEEKGLPDWLRQALDATSAVIASALNVLGLRHVVITGCLTELPAGVIEHLTASIQRGAMWARFGEVTTVTAPRRRTAGMVAAGLGRIVLANAHHRS